MPTHGLQMEKEGCRHYGIGIGKGGIGKGRNAGTTGSGKGGMQGLQDREREIVPASLLFPPASLPFPIL